MNNYREINIEAGLPNSQQAIDILKREIIYAIEDNVSVLKIIHGYGSSGAGGKLRINIRKFLDVQAKLKTFSCYIKGEDFDIFNKDTQQMLLKCEYLSKDKDLGRHNNGVTFICF